MPADPAPLLESRDADDDAAIEQVLVCFYCERCDMTFWFPATLMILDHPAVVSLCDDHGIDLRDRDYLELTFLTEGGGTVVAEDPVRVAVDIELDGDALRLTLDGTLAVVDVEQGSG